MADVGEGPVTAPRADGWEPYDATSDADCGPWAKVSANLDGGLEAQWRTDFPDDGGRWQQT